MSNLEMDYGFTNSEESVDPQGQNEGLPEETMINMKLIFNTCDTDQDGKVSVDDLRSTIEAYVGADNVAAIFNRLDVEKYNELSFEDFIALFSGSKRTAPQDDYKGYSPMQRGAEILSSSLLNVKASLARDPEEERDILQSNLERVQLKLEKAMLERDTIVEQYMELEEQLKATKQQIKAQQDQREKITYLLTEIESYKSELAVSVSRESELQKKIVQLKKDIKAATESNSEELTSLKSESISLRDRIKGYEEEILVLEETKAKYLQDSSKTQNYIKDLEEKVSMQSDRVVKLQSDYETLEQQSEEQIMSLKIRVQQLETELQMKDVPLNQSLKGTIFDEMQEIGRKSFFKLDKFPESKSLPRKQSVMTKPGEGLTGKVSDIFLRQSDSAMVRDKEISELKDQNSNLTLRESELKAKLEKEYRENSLLIRELEEKEMKFEESRYLLKKQHEEEISKLIHLYHKRSDLEKTARHLLSNIHHTQRLTFLEPETQNTNTSALASSTLETDVQDKLHELKVKLMSSDISKTQLIRRKSINARIQMLIDQSKLGQINHETNQISATYQEIKNNENDKSREKFHLFVLGSILCILVAMVINLIFSSEMRITS